MAGISPAEDKIRLLKLTNFVILTVVVACLFSMTLNNDIIENLDGDEEEVPREVIRKKALILAYFFFFIGIYFIYSAYQDYKAEKTRRTKIFLYVAIILFIAACLHLYNFYTTPDPGDEETI